MHFSSATENPTGGRRPRRWASAGTTAGSPAARPALLSCSWRGSSKSSSRRGSGSGSPRSRSPRWSGRSWSSRSWVTSPPCSAPRRPGRCCGGSEIGDALTRLRGGAPFPGGIAPSYDGHGLINVAHAALAALGIPAGQGLAPDVLPPELTRGVERVLLILIDGLGWEA